MNEFTDSAMVPTWVVCENTFKLWRVGEKPAPDVMLSPQAAAEVARLQAWAAQQVEQERAPRAAPAPARPTALPKLPSPPRSEPLPLVEVDAVRPTPHPHFDPAILARVAAMKSAARASPVSVLDA